jgi:hypothetical protein
LVRKLVWELEQVKFLSRLGKGRCRDQFFKTFGNFETISNGLPNVECETLSTTPVSTFDIIIN